MENKPAKLENKPAKRNVGWLIGAAGLFVLSKAKALIGLLKLSKFGSALISMAVTIWAYTIVYPVQVAVGLVAMIFIHEMGHVAAAKRKGLPVSAPFFIPFVGAFIMTKRHPRDAVTEAYVAFGGPFIGALGATAAFAVGWLGLEYGGGPGWYVWIIIAKIGFFINLFNLLPMKPLDGGRIAGAVSRALWIVGLIGGLFVVVYLRAWVIAILLVLFAYDLYKTYVKKVKHDPYRYTFQMETPLQPLLDAGVFIPGEAHRRELPFETYCTMDGTQRLTVRWDGMNLTETVDLPGQALIEKVEAFRVEQRTDTDPARLVVHVAVEGKTYTNDRYYDVPAGARIGYGLAYFGLAAYLLLMLGLAGMVVVPVIS